MENKTLVNKLCEVMAEVDRIPKLGFNTNQNYKFVTESDVLGAVRKLLAERHVMIIPSVVSAERAKIEHSEITKDGEIKLYASKQSLTTVTINYTFVDGDSDERLVVTMTGQGADAMDKGIFKAITGATKYCLLKTFLLPTGDDPEADESTDFAAGKEAARVVGEKKLADKAQGKPINAPVAPANASNDQSEAFVGTAHITMNHDSVTIYPELDPSLLSQENKPTRELTQSLWRKKMDAFNVTFDANARLWVTDARTLEVLSPNIEGLGYKLKITDKSQAPSAETVGGTVPPKTHKVPPAGFTTHRVMERKAIEKNGKAWWSVVLTGVEKKATIWDSVIGTFLESEPAGAEIVCTLRPAKDPKYGPSVEKVFRINDTEFDDENKPILQRGLL